MERTTQATVNKEDVDRLEAVVKKAGLEIGTLRAKLDIAVKALEQISGKRMEPLMRPARKIAEDALTRIQVGSEGKKNG